MITGHKEGQLNLAPQENTSVSLISRRWRLTFFFVVTALLAIAIAVIIVNRIIGDLAKDNLVRITEENTARDAEHIQSMMRIMGPTVADHSMQEIPFAEAKADAQEMQVMQQSNPLSLERLTSPEGLTSTFPMLVEGFNIVKFNLFDLNGNTLWSTDPASVGISQREGPLYQTALAGGISSKLAEDHNVIFLDGVNRRGDVVETYIPLRDFPSGQVIGVMEIYRDVTQDVAIQVEEAKSTVLWTTTATMGGLFLLLFGFVVVADRKITQSHENQLAESERAELELHEATVAALQATSAKSEFLASMSHEIRTPMNAIMGMADLLSETPLNREQQEYARIISTAADSLLALINDILDLSKVEAGEVTIEKTDFHLGDLIEKTAEVLAIRAHEKGLELVCHIESDVPVGLVGDSLRLNQVITNLVSNAIKFTENGEVTLHVANDPESLEIGSLLFRVTDTGIGIPPEKLGFIFDRFTQADSSTTRQYGGTGLGLAICNRLTELMEGRIWVESEVGQGSTFCFTSRFSLQAEPNVDLSPPREDLKGLKALIVDDSAASRTILKKMLAAWDITATEAEDGYRALAELERASTENEPYQVLLLDSDMPGMDGFQVAEHMSENLGVGDMVVMMLTTRERSVNIARCRELGISRYITKPVKSSELRQMIDVSLGLESSVFHVPPTGEKLDTLETQHALRILLVEDSEDNRLLIQSYLKKTPYQLDVAENGEIAVGKFTSGEYDLVLMDVQMPVMDGYAATEAIRMWEEGKGVKPTPILALTANALKEDAQKSLDAGCNGHITKPVKKNALMEAIFEHTTRQVRT